MLLRKKELISDMLKLFLEKVKNIFSKRVIAALICVTIFLFCGLLSRSLSTQIDYPDFFYNYVSQNVETIRNSLSFNFSSIIIFKWILMASNYNIDIFVDACGIFFTISISFLFLTISYLIYKMLRERSIYSFMLVVGTFAIYVFTTSHQFFFFDSILLPLSISSSFVSILMLLKIYRSKNMAAKLLNSFLTSIVLVIFANFLLVVVLISFAGYIFLKVVFFKKKSIFNILYCAFLVLLLIVYAIVFLAIGKPLFSSNIEFSGINIILTTLVNLSSSLLGPFYIESRFGVGIRIAISIVFLLVNIVFITLLTIKEKRITSNLLFFFSILLIELLFSFLNRKSSSISEQPYYSISIFFLLDSLFNLISWADKLSFYQKQKSNTRFFIANVFYALLLIISLASYSYATRPRQEMAESTKTNLNKVALIVNYDDWQKSLANIYIDDFVCSNKIIYLEKK